MRRYYKKMMLSMLDMLASAHEQILEKISKNETVSGLLRDAQHVVERIDSFMDNYDIPDQVVQAMRIYYDTLWQMNQTPCMAIYEQMNQYLATFHDSVDELIVANKIEVAFFPYSASMSDSLESIWEAAIKDPECDTFVVPIPYYNRDHMGNMAEMHYDGDYYASKVAITDWSKYNPEQRHPDIIFIHNPYDQNNHVTSVHPNFYSSKLKNETELLAYVPYFITRESLADHFCTAPGVQNSHKVFVQSEKDKNIYIENAIKHFGLPVNLAQDKFVSIGSPKIDRVLAVNHSEFVMMKEWDVKTIDAKMKKKKIILYITSLHNLLYGKGRYLEKMLSVFEYVHNREDVLLWWRPHPLTEDTLKSMLPQYVDAYERIRNLFVHKNIGIYDDTPDLHRAIALSDAYYGDYSSVVGLYSFSDKLILYQNDTVVTYRTDFDFSNTLKQYTQIHKQNGDFAMPSETPEGAHLSSFINYIVSDREKDEQQDYLLIRKEKVQHLAITNEGKTGAEIFNYCKNSII